MTIGLRETYHLDQEKIQAYRKMPLINDELKKIIESSKVFIDKSNNPDLANAILEYHIIDKQKNGRNLTYFIFEYFELEGVSATITALTVSPGYKLKSVFKLAEIEKYPDGDYKEYTVIEDNMATKTSVEKGIAGYIDSLDQLIMRTDSIVVHYQTNNFRRFEMLDSTFCRTEFLK